MRLNVSRHAWGIKNGIRPSSTNIKPNAIKKVLFKQMPYFLAPALRMYLKKSELWSNTITSDLLLKLFL